jgi:sugar-specific transcriptional regulator TrmB
MEIKKHLENVGLKGKKADVYLSALELGGATVIDIAKKAGIKRTTVYDVLLDLKSDGLISETAKGKKKLYMGENPEKIKKDLAAKGKIFDEILPELQAVYNIKGTKPKIRFYEGKEGLKEVYNDTLNYTGEMLAFASEDVVKILGKEWAQDYLKKRKERELHVRAIMPATKILKEDYAALDREQFRVSKLINPEKYPFSIEINVYGFQKTALMSSKEETGVIIEGAEIYKTMKLIFELVWDLLPEIKIK